MKRFYFLAILGIFSIPGYLMAQAGNKPPANQANPQQMQHPNMGQPTGTPQQNAAQQQNNAAPATAAAAAQDTAKHDYRSAKLKKLKPKKKLKIANQLADKGSYYNAIMYYEDVVAKQKDNIHAICQLAKLNYLLRDYHSAEGYFKTMYDLDTTRYIKAKYFLALMQKYNGNCNDANKNFKEFITSFKDKDKEENMAVLKKLVELQMAGCDLQVKNMSKPEKVLLDHLDAAVNSKFSNFAPHSYGKDQMIYASLRSDTAINVNSSDSLGEKAKEYIATKTGDTYGNVKLFPGATNSKEYHTGNGCMSPDGKRFYFTNSKLGALEIMQSDIYKSEYSNGQWSDPVKLGPAINDGSNNTHPNVAMVDGKEVMFFSSNRKGGKGGWDIWVAESNGKGDFITPKNLGPLVNTRYNEITPFFDSNRNTLYFSSDGHVSMGGFDIFKSMRAGADSATIKKGDYLTPVGLAAPFNSSVDDLYYALDSNGKEGFLVSNRAGGFSIKAPTCADNIYHFRIIHDIFLKAHVALKTDPATPVDSADVSFFIKENGVNTPIANLQTHKMEEFIVKLDPEKDYQVNVTKNGYWGSETVIGHDTLGKVKDTLNYTFFIEEILRRKIQLKRIYFEFDKYNITRDYKISLDSVADVMTANPTWTAELYGYCDSIGKDDYNMVLGKKRAQAAADYLALKGIDMNRLSLISRGEESPIAPNSTPDGKDNPVGRAKNRRVEYKLNSNDKQKPVDVEYLDEGPYKIDRTKSKSGKK